MKLGIKSVLFLILILGYFIDSYEAEYWSLSLVFDYESDFNDVQDVLRSAEEQ